MCKGAGASSKEAIAEQESGDEADIPPLNNTTVLSSHRRWVYKKRYLVGRAKQCQVSVTKTWKYCSPDIESPRQFSTE